jgi:hypothetical protein
MSDRKQAASVRDDPAAQPALWAEGSYVIERYSYLSKQGKSGVQWLVYRVEAGGFWMLTACETRREAAEFIGSRRG